MKFLFFLLVFFSAPKAFSFPEMIRHGYVNCQTCHISPNGGGILNDYGRELSRELLATWKSDSEKSKEHLAAYGVLSETPIEKWLKLGGDVRSLYKYQNDPYARQGETILMQGDLEAAILYKNFTLVGTLDYEGALGGVKAKELFSRRHYLLYGISEGLQVRIGRFIPAFGINTADHVTLTRSAVRMGPLFENYNAELTYYPTDKTEVFLTWVMGLPSSEAPTSESGAALQGTYALNETTKLGMSVFKGKDIARSRWLLGPNAAVGITKSLMAMSEIDYQSQTTTATGVTRNGILTTQKLSYEMTDGLWSYFLQEYGQTDFKSTKSQAQVYGLGFQFFPRTHFEFNLVWEKIKRDSFSSQFYDYFWLVAHFYL